MIPITCTHCGGASQVDEAWLGQWVQCPYCAKPTQAAPASLAGPPPPPPVSAAPAVEKEAKTQAESAKPQAVATVEAPAPRAPLTRAQRLAIRRRLNLVLAVGGGALLAATAYVLFLISQ